MAASQRCTQHDDEGEKSKPRRSLVRQRDGSNVIRTSHDRRVAHLASILPITSHSHAGHKDRRRRVIESRVYNEASAWLAWYHVQAPKTYILPQVHERLQRCDIDFSLQLMDSEFSPIQAAKSLAELMTTGNETTEELLFHADETVDETAFVNHTTRDPLTSPPENLGGSLRPIALVGAAFSSASVTLSTLASAYDLPQVSSSSTTSTLDNKETHPRFARTVPTNAGDARAAILYLADLQVSHVAVFYALNDYGRSYHADILREADRFGMDVQSVPYRDFEADNLKTSIRQLAESERRYIIGVLSAPSWKTVIREALEHDIIGRPDYLWLLTEASAELASPSFELYTWTEEPLARALDGVAMVLMDIEPHMAFDYALKHFAVARSEQEEFINQHSEPEYLRGFDFPIPFPSLYQYLTYDAVIALALAACDCPEDLFTGTELYEQLVKTEFQGVSGYVAFDPETGTRRATDIRYRIANLLVSERRSSETDIMFTARTTAIVNLGNETVHQRHPFVYAGLNTEKPDPLPPLQGVELNLVPTSVIILGLTFAGVVMFLSALFFAWTLLQRKTRVVVASQPFFLCMLCVGTFLAASAIIPMSVQEPVPQQALDVSCMFVPWLTSIGYVISMSALFSKTWRLNKIFGSGKTIKRVTVKAKDVMLPFIALMTVTVSFLAAWTAFEPLQWTRIPVDNYDAFGRSKESYAVCRSQPGAMMAPFCVPIIVVNVLALAIAMYQAYKARRLPVEYRESTYIALVVASLMEAIVLGIPLLFMTVDNPTTFYLVRCILIGICCLAILLPIFVPKLAHLNNLRLPGRNVRASNLDLSGGGGETDASARPLSTRNLARRGSLQVTMTRPDGTVTSVNVGAGVESQSSLQRLFRSSLRTPSGRRILEANDLNRGAQNQNSTRITRKRDYYTQRSCENAVGLSLLSGSTAYGDANRIFRNASRSKRGFSDTVRSSGIDCKSKDLCNAGRSMGESDESLA